MYNLTKNRTFTAFLLSFWFMLPLEAQNLKKILDKGSPEKLKNYIEKGNSLNDPIETFTDKGDAVETNAMTYVLGIDLDKKTRRELFNILLENSDKFKNEKDIINESFIYSLSNEDSYYSDILWKKNPDPKAICTICLGNSALFVAATYGSDWYFRLKNNSDIKMISKSGNSILHAAVSGENIKIITDAMAETDPEKLVNLPNKDDLTPLDLAFQAKDKSIADMMLKAGADPKKAKNVLAAAGFHFNTKVFELPYAKENSSAFYDDLWEPIDYFPSLLPLLCVWDTEENLSQNLILKQDFSQIEMIRSAIIAMTNSIKDKNYPLEKKFDFNSDTDAISLSLFEFVNMAWKRQRAAQFHRHQIAQICQKKSAAKLGQ